MLYRVLADLVVLSHLAFIIFGAFGGLLAFRWRWMPWVHLPAVAWGTAVEVFGLLCPLTTLENTLRTASGDAGYAGGFVEYYIIPLIYPDELTRGMQVSLGCLLVVINIAVYSAVWRHRRRQRAAAIER